MQFAETEIYRLTAATWSSMLGLQVERAAQRPSFAEGFCTGSIEFSGAWEGVLNLDFSQSLARSVAAVLFGSDPQEAGEKEVRDAVGELTNLVAGAVKSLLPEPSYLALPIVTQGLDTIDYRLRLSDGDLLAEVTLECQGEPLRLTLMQRSLAASPAPGLYGIAGTAAVERAWHPQNGTGSDRSDAGPDITNPQAQRIVAAARAEAEEIREGARRYALELLDGLESYTCEMVESIRKSRDRLQSG